MPRYYRTSPMVLRGPEAMQDIDVLLREMNAKKVKEETNPPEAGIVREQVWELTPGVFLQVADDIRSGRSAALVLGEDEERMTRIADLVEKYLHPLTAQELLAAVATTDEEERARGVLTAGFGAPHEYDEEFFSSIRDAMFDESPLVRFAAVWTTTYAFWPEYRDVLRQAAETDPDLEIRADARALAEAPIDQYGRRLTDPE